METRKLSREYTYRQIRASIYLIMSAVVCVMTEDVPQTMYEVANQVYSLVSYPPEFNTETSLPFHPAPVNTEESSITRFRSSNFAKD